MSSSPAALPGPVTNINNPLNMGRYQNIWDHSIPNRSDTLVIVSIIFVILASLVYYTRQFWRLKHHLHGLDDIMCLLAYLTLVVETILVCMAAYYGFGRHRIYIEATLLRATFCFYVYQIFYKILGMFTKLTFLVMYLRIFGTRENRKFKVFTWIMIAAVSVGSLVFAVVSIWQCSPVERAWDKSVSGHCVNNMAFWYSHAAWNTICDCIIYIMPIPMIRTLQMAHGQKLGLISVFLLGAFAIAASIVRMAVLDGSASATDQTWGSAIALYWTQIEACTSVICCCLPALRVPFMNCWRRVRGQSTGGSGPDIGLPYDVQHLQHVSRRRSTPIRFDTPFGGIDDNNGNNGNNGNNDIELAARPLGNLTTVESVSNMNPANEGGENAGPASSHQAKAESKWYDNVMSLIDRDTYTPEGSSHSSYRSRAAARARNSITSYHEDVMENGEPADWSGTWPEITKTSDWRVSSHERSAMPLRREDQEPTLEEILAAGPPGKAADEE